MAATGTLPHKLSPHKLSVCEKLLASWGRKRLARAIQTAAAEAAAEKHRQQLGDPKETTVHRKIRESQDSKIPYWRRWILSAAMRFYPAGAIKPNTAFRMQDGAAYGVLPSGSYVRLNKKQKTKKQRNVEKRAARRAVEKEKKENGNGGLS